MIIDHKNKVVFFYIPENLGTEIHKVLETKDGVQKFWKTPVYNKTPDLAHLNQKNYQDYVKNPEVDTYSKMCCIQNPYDRFLSTFNGYRHKNLLLWAKENGIDIADINSVLDYFLENPDEIYNPNIPWYSPQHIYTHVDDELSIEYICDTSTIEDNLQILKENFDYDLSLKNVPEFYYKKQYTAKFVKSIEIIYAKDFELLKFNKYDPFMYVEKVYINLDHRKDKRKYLEDQLEKEKIDFSRFEAINGKKLDVNKMRKEGKVQNNKLVPGQIGCSLSHIQCWNDLLESDKDYMVVLEDDARLASDFKSKLKDILINLRKYDADIIYLLIRYLPRSFPRAKCGPVLDELLYIPEQVGWGTLGYIIGRTGAEKLIKENTPIKEVVDSMDNIRKRTDLKLIAVRENLVTVTEIGNSDIRKYGKQW